MATSNAYINSTAFNDSSLPYIYKVFLRYSGFESEICCRFDTSRQTDYLPYSTSNEGQPRRSTIDFKHFIKSSIHYIYTMHSKIHKCSFLPTGRIYVFCVDLRTNSYYFPVQHKLIGRYNRDGMCLLRCTGWILK